MSALGALPFITAHAQTAQIRIGVQPGMSYLPFYVMEHEKLLEKRLTQAGLPASVSWLRFANGPAMNDGLLSGSLDVVGTGIPSFLTIWAKARGPLEVIGLAAYGSVPTVLVSRNPNVKTVADFTEADRIAVPAANGSLQSMLLQMEAEKVFGAGNWSKLDHLMISRGHPDAAIALLSHSSEVTAHFSASPYYIQELRDPTMHAVLKAEDITGRPISNGMMYIKKSFYTANRQSIQQMLLAMQDSFDLIKSSPESAAKMYTSMSGDKTDIADIVAIITAPGSIYELTPRSFKAFADFMFKVGTINRSVGAWNDLFIDEIKNLPGS